MSNLLWPGSCWLCITFHGLTPVRVPGSSISSLSTSVTFWAVQSSGWVSTHRWSHICIESHFPPPCSVIIGQLSDIRDWSRDLQRDQDLVPWQPRVVVIVCLATVIAPVGKEIYYNDCNNFYFYIPMLLKADSCENRQVLDKAQKF